ncbi:MAG: hypothetical protein K2M65_02880, partial [Muribaculaceae bacterium]|nr:hypothetical protein [Muribaculaceae bacterium]
MQSLTPELKRAIYNILKENGYISTLIENGGLMDILSELWDVYSLPATGNDLRYKNFGRELHKHYVLNSDWTDDEVFIDHLRLLETEDTKFIRFVKDILNNNQVKSPLPIKIIEVMQLLGEGGYMVTFETVDGYTVFTIEINADLLNETEANDICFFVTVAKKDSRSDRFSGHEAPDRFPSFMLVHNPKWNDYSCWSWFSLFYYPDADHGTFIGNVKIIKRGEDDTMKFIPKEFYTLPDAFCSLGLSTDYYTALHNVFGHDGWRVAKALRDCACFSEIEEAFANDVNFRYSLRRENSSEKALREGRFLLAGYDMGGCYSFKYKYLPGYAEEFDDLVGIDFNFKYECQPFERIIGLIGENGVGKTSLLRQITDDLSHKRHSAFDGSLPFYSKIIV